MFQDTKTCKGMNNHFDFYLFRELFKNSSDKFLLAVCFKFISIVVLYKLVVFNIDDDLTATIHSVSNQSKSVYGFLLVNDFDDKIMLAYNFFYIQRVEKMA